MAAPINKDTLIELRTLLANENQDLMSGDFEGVARAAQRKLELVEWLETAFSDIDPSVVSQAYRDEIRQIVAIAQDNSAHLLAIRNGLQSALARMQGISGEQHVGSYGSDGHLMPFPKAVGMYLKKV